MPRLWVETNCGVLEEYKFRQCWSPTGEGERVWRSDHAGSVGFTSRAIIVFVSSSNRQSLEDWFEMYYFKKIKLAAVL